MEQAKLAGDLYKFISFWRYSFYGSRLHCIDVYNFVHAVLDFQEQGQDYAIWYIEDWLYKNVPDGRLNREQNDNIVDAVSLLWQNILDQELAVRALGLADVLRKFGAVFDIAAYEKQLTVMMRARSSKEDAVELLNEAIGKFLFPRDKTIARVLRVILYPLSEVNDAKVEIARMLLFKMFDSNLLPGPMSFDTVMCGYARLRRPTDGLALLSEMQNRGINPTDITFMHLIESCVLDSPHANPSVVDESTDMLKTIQNKMAEFKLAYTEISSFSLARACAGLGRISEAWDALKFCSHCDPLFITPERFHSVFVIFVHNKSQRNDFPREAYELAGLMRDEFHLPWSSETLNCLIVACARMCEVFPAATTLRQFEREHIYPTEVGISHMLQLLINKPFREAWHTIKPVLWHALLLDRRRALEPQNSFEGRAGAVGKSMLAEVGHGGFGDLEVIFARLSEVFAMQSDHSTAQDVRAFWEKISNASSNASSNVSEWEEDEEEQEKQVERFRGGYPAPTEEGGEEIAEDTDAMTPPAEAAAPEVEPKSRQGTATESVWSKFFKRSS
mmetsp:Transcript_7604/g.18742  ORF Transcript_7604/g.18742 Transcript_7604/m.18742 type:complete len:560 (+) Transcript_7604:331-2010(+)